jgi:hypothetical protein
MKMIIIKEFLIIHSFMQQYENENNKGIFIVA